MPESNLRQAQHPEGAELIINRKGTAPALRMRIGGCWVFAVPGVPAEMIELLDTDVLPFLRRSAGEHGVVVSRLVRTWGESESRIGELLGDLYESSRNPTVAFLASSGEIKVRLTARGHDAGAAGDLIAPVEKEVRRRLGSLVFGVDSDTVERVLFTGLGDRGWSLGTAESATGGMVAERITAIPGASDHFVGSVVAYATDVKLGVLGVPADVVDELGAVSEPVARAMAEGAANVLGADVVIAVTGSAGPDPQERAVGTMVIAVRTPEDTRSRMLHMPGDRERVRVYTTTAALHLARLAVAGDWWDHVPDRWGPTRKT